MDLGTLAALAIGALFGSLVTWMVLRDRGSSTPAHRSDAHKPFDHFGSGGGLQNRSSSGPS